MGHSTVIRAKTAEPIELGIVC